MFIYVAVLICYVLTKSQGDNAFRRLFERNDSELTCYEKLGCFSKENSPFRNLPAKAESPDQLQTRFLLYTWSNPYEAAVLDYLNETSFETQLYSPNKNLYVVVHGFQSSAEIDWMMDMKNELLLREDCNVILVDWSKGAMATFVYLYTQAVVNVEIVAQQLAITLKILRQKRNLIIENIHGMGHSLGAHVLGLTGRDMQREFNATIGRITGMDPAGPEFEQQEDWVRLTKDDASFVDVIHTSAGCCVVNGAFGLLKQSGHVDFYPNGGTNPQPGCNSVPIIQEVTTGVDCSHSRSHDLFLESLRQDNQGLDCSFTAYHCQDCTECGDGGCGVMGIDSLQAPGRGKLYLKTNGKSPFCINQN